MIGAVSADLIGNWSWTTWLLVPLVIVLAALTTLVLGSRGEPRLIGRRSDRQHRSPRGELGDSPGEL